MPNNKKNINVTIPSVIAWFMESEECILNNHAQRIPNSAVPEHAKEIIQPIDDWIDLHHC